MRNNVVFIGEENRANNELYQLLNWRFKIEYFGSLTHLSLENLKEMEPSVLIVSMVGNHLDYRELFDYMVKECGEVPVVTISTKAESEAYEAFYEKKQFHRILRPVLGRRVLEICRKVIVGSAYNDEESEAAQTEKGHILVVDDNAMVLRNIKGILEEHYSVAVAPSGIHGFVSIGKKQPDLILLDYEMPEMNGKQFLEKLQENEELKDIPVVFLTSMDSKEIVMSLLALKPAGYLLKPVESQLLHDKIREITGK